MRIEACLTFAIILSRKFVQPKTFEISAIDEINRIPSVVFGSDDEILTPLYEIDCNIDESGHHSLDFSHAEDLEQLVPIITELPDDQGNLKSFNCFDRLHKIFHKEQPQLNETEDQNSEQKQVSRLEHCGLNVRLMNFDIELVELEEEAIDECISPGALIAATNISQNEEKNDFPSSKSELNEYAPGTLIVAYPENPTVETAPVYIVSDPGKSEDNSYHEVIETGNDNGIDYAEDKETFELTIERINEMNYGLNYSGPRINLETEITARYVLQELVPYFLSGKHLDVKSAYAVTLNNHNWSLVDVNIEATQKLIIFGDIHGQFHDFIRIVQDQGPPSNSLKYIFNGDIVDRGKNSVECLLTLLAFKIAQPNNFFVGLGNHETATVGRLQFYKETLKKYRTENFFEVAHMVFKSFPISFLVQKEIFVTHGGIPPNLSLDRIREIERLNPNEEDEDIINDLTWSDPVPGNGLQLSHRGLGYLYGPDITKDFVFRNNISLIIRSHQYKELGFSEEHDGYCVTIFSCPNYRGKMGNYGAFIRLDNNLNMTFQLFKAVKSKKDYPPIPSKIVLSRNVKRQK